MNINIIFVIALSFVYGIGSIALLFQQWKRLSNENVKTMDTWMKWYTVAILVSNLIIMYFMQYFYSELDIFHTIRNMTIVSLLWIAAAIDKKYYVIPNQLILVGLSGWCIITVVEIITKQEMWLNKLISEAIAVGGLLVISAICLLVMKNSIGMGDLKMLIIMALYLGISGFLSAVFLSLLVSFFAAVVLLLRKVKSRKDTIPFGPFLLTGTLAGIILTGL